MAILRLEKKSNFGLSVPLIAISLDVVKGGQNHKKRMILDWMNLLLQDSACIGRYHSDSKGDWFAVKSMIGWLKILTRFAQNYS